MKKVFSFAMLGAIALAGAMFTSCQSDEDVQVNPTYDGENVKTQFSISIPGALKTRMTAKDAQEDEVFSGMTAIRLYPYPQAITAGTEAVNTAPIELADIATTGLNETGTANEFHGTVYNDVDVPIGTTNFLFYGKKTSTTSGALTATFATKGQTANNTTFAQVNYSNYLISTVGSTVGGDEEGKKLLAALNAVATKIETERSAAATATEPIEGTITDFQALYESNKAGCAKSVSALFEDMIATLGTSSNARLLAIKGVVETQKTEVDALTFPRNLDLPDGSVGVACTSHVFAFSAQNNAGMGTPELNTYMKPAELYYFVNTPIHVSYSTHQPEYASQASWTDVVALYTNGTKVASTTRGVVLDNKIQYAVAQLITDVKVKASTTLKANDGTPATTKVNVAAPASGYSFNVTGLLIGSQGNVDWKFQPAATGTNIVYDKVWTGTTSTSPAVATASAATVQNHTLVLETVGVPTPASNPANGTNDEIVRVAVELENNGDDFFGYNDELIPHGSRFYLVAELKVSDAWTSGKPKKVFQQDYKTIAHFTIGENSLCNAYNTIPDLRTPKLELGLAVDLIWTPGLEFNVEFQ